MVDKFSVVCQSGTRDDDGEERIRVTLPYVKGISEALRRILAHANITTATFHPMAAVNAPEIFS